MPPPASPSELRSQMVSLVQQLLGSGHVQAGHLALGLDSLAVGIGGAALSLCRAALSLRRIALRQAVRIPRAPRRP